MKRLTTTTKLAALIAMLAVPVLLAYAGGPKRIIVENDDGTRTVMVPEAAATAPATVPSVDSPPPIGPQLPLTRIVAPNKPDRGNGRTLSKSDATVRRAVVDGWEQNIVAENLGNTPVLIDDVRILNAYRQNPEDLFTGQAIYLAKSGPVVIRGVFAKNAGWKPGAPASDRNGYRHIIYGNFGVASLLVEDSWLDEAACAAIQSRGGPVLIRRCLLNRAAIAICAVMGNWRIEDSTVYDGHHYYQPQEGKPAVWTGNVAVMAYWPVDMVNVWIVGHPDQAAPDLATNLKAYNLGAVICSAKYGKAEWYPAVDKNPKDGKTDAGVDLVTARDCRIIGWPGPPFSGDRRDDGNGFIVGGNPVNVRAALAELSRPLETDEAPDPKAVALAVAKAQALIRSAALN